MAVKVFEFRNLSGDVAQVVAADADAALSRLKDYGLFFQDTDWMGVKDVSAVVVSIHRRAPEPISYY